MQRRTAMETAWMFYCVLMIITAVVGHPLMGTAATVDVKFIRHHEHPRIRRDLRQSLMPDVIISSFPFSGRDIFLRLRRVQNLRTYIVGQNGTRKFNYEPRDSSVYVDPTRSASMIARRSKYGDFVLEGILEHQGRKLSMSPAVRRRRSSGRGGNPHTVAVVAEKITFGDDALPPHRTGNSHAQENNPGTVVRRRRQATGTTVHTLETVFVVDNSDYKNWVKRYPNDSLSRLTEFYTLIAQSVDGIFRSVNQMNPSLDIKIKVIQLYVLETAANSQFSENEFIVAGGGPIEGGDYLNSFRDWIPTRAAQGLKQNADHYMAFTAYNIVLDGSEAVGVARKGEVCEVDSVSVVENSIKPAVANIAAHEIGHCLDASHDGKSEASTCSPRSQFVMTPTFVVPLQSATADPQNLFDFSKCSVAAFAKYLSQPSVTCTRPAETTASAALTSTVTGSLVTDRDAQCRFITGLGDSYRCEFGPPENEICTSMLCYTFNNGTHDFCDYVLPFEGTPCGADLVCQQGQCVKKSATQTSTSTSGTGTSNTGTGTSNTGTGTSNTGNGTSNTGTSGSRPTPRQCFSSKFIRQCVSQFNRRHCMEGECHDCFQVLGGVIRAC